MDVRTSNRSHKQYKIPYFLLKKSEVQQKKSMARSRNKSYIHKEFEQLIVRDQHSKALIHKRAKIWIKNTPKIIIKSQNLQYMRFQCQCPKKLFIQHLKLHSKLSQIEKTLQIAQALFQLSQTYGYFYCDKQMLKISADGIPVVWIHQNFSATEREFPIAQSPVAEFIFLKKIKTTLNQIFHFPKNIHIQTKKQLIAYLQNQRRKINKFCNKYPQLPFKRCLNHSKQNDLGKSSKSKYSALDCPSHTSISPIHQNFLTPTKIYYGRVHHTSTMKDLPKDRRTSSNYLRRQSSRQLITRSRQRIKTTKFHKDSYHLDCKAQQSQKQHLDGSSISHTTSDFGLRIQLFDNTIRSNLNPQGNIKNLQLSNHENSQYKSEIQDSIQQQFNFEHQEVSPAHKKDIHEKKIRKQSADESYTKSWFKSQPKIQQKTFPNSTFSTRVTFSSVKGEFQCASDQQKSESKHEIPHLYPLNKEKQPKQKINIGKKMMKESKIAQEDSFENDVQNLFQSQIIINVIESKPKLKQSQLSQQIEKLFDSGLSSERQDASILEDFEKVLFP